MAGLNRVWSREKRRSYNDLIGWELTVLGTTYAVILGFMLNAVWTALYEAELNVDLEASPVLDAYRLGEGLQEPQRNQLLAHAPAGHDRALTRLHGAGAFAIGAWRDFSPIIELPLVSCFSTLAILTVLCGLDRL